MSSQFQDIKQQYIFLALCGAKNENVIAEEATKRGTATFYSRAEAFLDLTVV